MCHIHLLELGETHSEGYTKRIKQWGLWFGLRAVLDVSWWASYPSSCFFLFASTGMPDEMNLSDVKQIHQTDGSSTLDTTGAGCTATTETMALALMGAVMLLPGLW